MITPPKTNNFGIESKEDLKYLNQLRLQLSSLRNHKFCHNFSDIENAQCPFMDGLEDNFHFLFNCKNYYAERKVLFNTIYKTTKINLLERSCDDKVNFLLYGDKLLSDSLNKQILMATICYINSTDRLSKF